MQFIKPDAAPDHLSRPDKIESGAYQDHIHFGAPYEKTHNRTHLLNAHDDTKGHEQQSWTQKSYDEPLKSTDPEKRIKVGDMDSISLQQRRLGHGSAQVKLAEREGCAPKKKGYMGMQTVGHAKLDADLSLDGGRIEQLDIESQTPPIVSLISGGVAGAVEAAATYPFEFAKTRAQLRNESGVPTPRNPFLVVGQVFRQEGACALYKGCTTLIAGSIAKDGVRFLSFDIIKNSFADPETGALSPLRNLLAGMSAGVVASIFAVTPTERIKTALIDDARGMKRFHSPTHAVKTIYGESGFPGLYRGFAGTTLKQASATAFRMGTYNILKEYERSREINQTTATNFANGAIAGIVTTYTTQPFDTIKTRSQSAKGASTVDAFKTVLADDGIRGFWRGTTMRLGRTILSGGILFTVYEEVVAVLNPLFRR